ncbi:aldo/keto reductase [Specibacter sp. NPDC078692]
MAQRIQYASGDMRTTISKFSEQNRPANQGLLDQVTAIAETKGASSGQIALAWFLAQQPWIVPIPGPVIPH